MDVPIQITASWEGDENDDTCEQTITNVSLGGLAIVSSTPLAVLDRVQVSIPVLDQNKPLVGNVVWCEKSGSGYEIGVEFERSRDMFRMRMIEQICHIEHYRREVLQQEGRRLTNKEAATEWIAKYASDFPPL